MKKFALIFAITLTALSAHAEEPVNTSGAYPEANQSQIEQNVQISKSEKQNRSNVAQQQDLSKARAQLGKDEKSDCKK